MGAEIKEEPKKATKKAKKSATVPVNGAALRKAIKVREPVKMYKYGEVWGSKFDIDEETFHVKRSFIAVPVESKIDLANMPEEQKNLRNLVVNKVHGLGYYTSDVKLLGNTFFQVESQMDSLRHEMQYDSDEESNRKSYVKVLSILTTIMHEANKLVALRRNMRTLVLKGDLKDVPQVAPPPSEYRINKYGEFVREESEEERMERLDSEFGFEEVDPNDESVPTPIRELASKLGNCKTIKMARVPVKKA